MVDARLIRIIERGAGEGGTISRYLERGVSNAEIMVIINSRRWLWRRWRAAGRALILLLIIDEEGGPNCLMIARGTPLVLPAEIEIHLNTVLAGGLL